MKIVRWICQEYSTEKYTVLAVSHVDAWKKAKELEKVEFKDLEDEQSWEIKKIYKNESFSS